MPVCQPEAMREALVTGRGPMAAAVHWRRSLAYADQIDAAAFGRPAAEVAVAGQVAPGRQVDGRGGIVDGHCDRLAGWCGRDVSA